MGISLGTIAIGTLLLAGIVLLGAGIFAVALAKAGKRTKTEGEEGLDTRSRSLLRTFDQEEQKVKSLIQSHPHHPLVQGLAMDLLAEIEAMKSGSAELAEKSSRLRQASIAQGRLQHQVQELTSRAGRAQGAERAGIDTSLQAKQSELAMAEAAGEQSRELDARIESAAAELSLMRAKLEQAALTDSYDSDEDSLRSSLNRLHSLWSSAEEAQDFINLKP